MSNTPAPAAETTGRNYTTATVHRAVPAGPEGQLKQLCGMNRRQVAYLFEIDAPVTCKRCNGLPVSA